MLHLSISRLFIKIIVYHAVVATTKVLPGCHHSWPASQYPDHAPGSRVGRHRASHYSYIIMIISPNIAAPPAACWTECRIRHEESGAQHSHVFSHQFRTNQADTRAMAYQHYPARPARITYFCTSTHPTAPTLQHTPRMRTRRMTQK